MASYWFRLAKQTRWRQHLLLPLQALKPRVYTDPLSVAQFGTCIMSYTNVSRTCAACTCEIYVWGMWCGETKHTPELREACWSSPRVFSGFTCSVPPKHLLHFLLSEHSWVPWGDNQGDHVGWGDFQSRESLYYGGCGRRSRKNNPIQDKTSSKYNMNTLLESITKSFDILQHRYVYVRGLC